VNPSEPPQPAGRRRRGVVGFADRGGEARHNDRIQKGSAGRGRRPGRFKNKVILDHRGATSGIGAAAAKSSQPKAARSHSAAAAPIGRWVESAIKLRGAGEIYPRRRFRIEDDLRRFVR